MVAGPFTLPNPTDVLAAAGRLAGIANQTPVMTARALDALTGRRLYLKCESFQRGGSFKFRGAYNAISQLSERERAAGVITHSSGNHAQGVALAASLQEVQATVVMPVDAPHVKREATQGYGASIVPCKAIDREAVTAALVAEHGYTLIHPYDNSEIIAGQGTAALELFDEAGELDLLFVPVGGGGLISGSALAAAERAPKCRLIGVEPEQAADAGRSWRSGEIFRFDRVPNTIADGLRPRSIGERNLAIMKEYVAEMVTVSEEAIVDSLHFLWQRMKLIVEPSAAVALAPLLAGSYEGEGRRVGVILSGGNVDFSKLDALIGNARPSAQARPATVQPEIGSPVPVPQVGEAAADSERTASGVGEPRILVCDDIDESGLQVLREAAEVDVKTGLSEDELQAIVGGYEALVIGDETPVSGQVIEYGYRLRVIGCTGRRLDNIDVSAARALGIEVRFSPGRNAVAVAEHTVGLMLRLSNEFDLKQFASDRGLAGKTLGLIGFGRIGRQVAQRALAFEMRVLVNQPRLTPELALSAGVEVADLPDLLSQSDFISLHVPFKAETETLLGAAELALVKPSAFLINTTHTDLVDDEALLDALDRGRLLGAALARFESKVAEAPARPSPQLLGHHRVLLARHVTSFGHSEPSEAAAIVARRILESLRARSPSESLSLLLAPIERVMPHEQIDEKRVARLMKRLSEDGLLVNPPVVTLWKDRYIVLDGATRYSALRKLGLKHVVVQAVPAGGRGFSLHTWYHVISSDRSFAELQAELQSVPGLVLRHLPDGRLRTAFDSESALCYLLDEAGRPTLVIAEDAVDRLAVMNEMVATYTRWGKVERTLLTDLSRLTAQFPNMVAVAVYPQFSPKQVFDTAREGKHLPAGLTRFVVPGRILRLNVELERLRRPEPLASKRAWFDRFLGDKLARSRLRYYQEPVILLDE